MNLIYLVRRFVPQQFSNSLECLVRCTFLLARSENHSVIFPVRNKQVFQRQIRQSIMTCRPSSASVLSTF